MDLAHGLGGGSDLPIPASYAVLGGAAALTISFAVLVMAWRRPRYEGGGGGRPVPARLVALVEHPALLGVARGIALLVAAVGVLCLVAGEDSPSTNPVFGLVYVLLWVGLVPASLLAGPVVRMVSPLRTLHLLGSRLLGRDPERGLRTLPSWVGLWPSAFGLLAFTWMELVSPDGTTLAVVGTWFAAYAVVMLLGAVVFGSGWFAAADPFEVYSELVARLSVWSREESGRLVVVSPLRNLARTPVRPGLVAVVGVLLGSTAFDSYRESVGWLRFTQANPTYVVPLETLLLLGVSAAVALVFAAATAAPRHRPGLDRRDGPGLLAHSVVPIIVGYMTAHYLTLFVETGQLTVILLSDPLATGVDLLGTADLTVSLWLSLHPTLLAMLKVAAIVLGHIVGVVAAHDRSLAMLPRRSQATGQLPLLLVMVAFTVGGLTLLFGL